VAVAGVLALAVLGSLFAWMAFHPITGPAVEVAVTPQPPTEELATVEASIPVAAVETLPADESQPRKSTLVRRTPDLLPDEPRTASLPDPPLEPKEEPPTDPLLPEQGKEPAPPAERVPARPTGETYGTSVLFLSNPEQAARVAHAETKLLFVLHVSGNFEESCFT
jgi:hypothetical protein